MFAVVALAGGWIASGGGSSDSRWIERGNIGGGFEGGVGMAEELLAFDPLPSVSSACLKGMDECKIAVPGGSLKLTNIKFGAPGKPGTAIATGVVKGVYVTGTVDLKVDDFKAPPGPGVEPGEDKDAYWSGVGSSSDESGEGKEEREEEEMGGQGRGKEEERGAEAATASMTHPIAKMPVLRFFPRRGRGAAKHASARRLPAKATSKLTAAVGGEEGGESEEYKLALAAVEKHMLARQEKIEAEARRIAEAVTRAITSPAMTSKVAKLAVEAAAANSAAPVLAESQLAGLGSSSFGFASQPAGAKSTLLAGSTEPVARPAVVPMPQQRRPVGEQVGMGSAWQGVNVVSTNDPWRAFRSFQQSVGQEP